MEDKRQVEALEKMKRLLQSKKPATRRFFIDARHYAACVPEMLKVCYKAEVEQRGRVYKEDAATAEHLRLASAWLVDRRRDRKPGLFLYGEPGNGKTTMANAMRTLVDMLYGNEDKYDDCKGVVSVSALELAAIAKGESKDRTLNSLKTTELLHIDDVGTEPASLKVWGNEVSPLTEILYARYDAMLYTVVTSNLSEEDIRPRYGNRIEDRLRELFDFISFDNDSYR